MDEQQTQTKPKSLWRDIIQRIKSGGIEGKWYSVGMKPVIDLTKILTKDHEKKWVALSRDNTKVVNYDADLLALDKKVAGQDVVFMKVPPSDVYLSF
jgi:hypothetical protein